MSIKRKTYSYEEKLFLLRSYYSSGMSKNAFCKKHGLCNISHLNRWLLQYSDAAKVVSLRFEQEIPEMANRSKDDYQVENAQLKKRIKDLEKALAFSKLETEARDLMITRAEEYFNVPIRKKSGAK